eukprot:scaffold6802_cov109-Isochrysis_galbana.AAC.3
MLMYRAFNPAGRGTYGKWPKTTRHCETVPIARRRRIAWMLRMSTALRAVSLSNPNTFCWIPPGAQ